MSLAFALSPFIIVAVGALMLMLAEAFSTNTNGLAAGTSLVLVAGGIFSGAVWMTGLGRLGVEAVAPWLILDRFALFFFMLLCLGGALATLLAGGYLPEHNLDRGEFYSLILFTTFGAMMLAAAGDLLTVFLGSRR